MTHQILGRQIVYKGHVFTIEKVQIRLPDNRERSYDLVVHGNAVTIVPVTPEGDILFVRQYRLGSEGDLLELPAGMLESGEDPLESANREVREETGMAARRMELLGSFYMGAGYCTEMLHAYLATDLTPSPLPQDSDEFIDLVRIPTTEAIRMARAGELRDGKTIAALLMAESRL
jgi:ADP-ribose pyrophosphatase